MSTRTRLLPLLALLLGTTCSLSGQQDLLPYQDADGIAPWSQAGIRFEKSLVQAIQTASKITDKHKRRIVVYTVDTIQGRNRLPWILQQLAIWSHPATRMALQDVPVVAMGADNAEVKQLRLPKNGICVLDGTGRQVRTTLDLGLVSYRKVPTTLLEVFRPRALAPEEMVADAEQQLRSMQLTQQAMVRHLRAADPKAAQAEIDKLAEQLPEHFIPRLLTHGLRVQREMPEALKRLPAPRPHADFVVIVEDLAGYLQALRGWSNAGIYPILFREARWLPRFLARYRPGAIHLLPSKGPARVPEAATVFRTWAAASGHAEDVSSLPAAVKAWQQHPARSPGLVYTHPEAAMLPAALALAAGRRQLLAFLPEVDDPQRTATWEEVASLRAGFRDLLRKHLIAGQRMFDELDFVTLCSQQPYRYRNEFAVDKSPYAVDDALCRDRFDLPMAFVGRLVGGRAQSNYQAMCALFLQPTDALLFSRYGKAGIWGQYATPAAAEELSKRCKVTHINHPAASLSAWQQLFAGRPMQQGLLHVNSSGGPRDWTTSTVKGSFLDLPPAGPVSVSYVHSNSMGNPYDRDTIGGRWLHNGAYTFFGSTHEPYLDAFVAVHPAYARILRMGQPLGMAMRMFPGQLRWRSWKLMLAGDPLLRLRPGHPAARVEAEPPAGCRPLRELQSGNPFAQRGLHLQLARLQGRLLREGAEPTRSPLQRLLQQLGRGAQKPEPRAARELAELCAQVLSALPGRELLLSYTQSLRSLGIQDAAFECVAAHMLLHELRQLDGSPAQRGAELGKLIPLHASLGGGRQANRVAAARYGAVLAELEGGKQLRSELRKSLRRAAQDGSLPASARDFAAGL